MVRVWQLEGLEITRLCINYSLTILMAGSAGEVTVTIEAPFTLRSSAEIVFCEPQHSQTLAPILQLVHKTASSLTAYANGRLVVALDGGSELVVEKDASFESWATSGTGIFQNIGMLCTPHNGPPWRL